MTQGANTTESYSYDPVGNRQSSLGVPSYTVNSSNELTGSSSASYTYDQNGNTTSKTDSSGTTNYTWDFENRLMNVTLPSSAGTATFKYDPFGRRIQKAFTQNGTTTTTNYVYDGDDLTQTTDQSGNAVAKFAQGENIDEPLAESTSSATDYYERDGLGSVTSLTSATGSIAQTYTYDSFGNTTHSTGSLANPFQYTAREIDSETGLYYYRARYYDPHTGRFLGEDPFGFSGGSDFYAYVYDNPTTLSDPLGLRAKNKKFCCLVRLPSDPDASILARLIYAEATGGDKIDPTDSSKEMIAIAETAINRADYLVTHPKKQYMFPHTADTIPGVIVPSQYGSLNKPTRFNAPLTPSKLGQIECDFLARAIAAANEALRNPAADPSSSGTFGVRTKGHGGPTGDFSPLPSIPGSNNSFFTLRENQ